MRAATSQGPATLTWNPLRPPGLGSAIEICRLKQEIERGLAAPATLTILTVPSLLALRSPVWKLSPDLAAQAIGQAWCSRCPGTSPSGPAIGALVDGYWARLG